MKLLKITVPVLLALNIAIPAFQSCTKDSSKTDTTAPRMTLENLVNAYNKDVIFEQDKAIFTEGDMTILTLPSKEVLFFLNRGDESKNDIFIGQGTELSSMIQKELGKVKVAYLREAIAVQTEDGNMYVFTIGERKGHELVQKLAAVWSGKGYGLAYNHSRALGPSNYKGLSSISELVLERAATPSECKCRALLHPNNDSDCNSGGVGATSCSVGATVVNGATVDPGCNVSCGENHYACCKNYHPE